MRMSQVGDRVRVHFVQTFEDGSVRSSRTAGAALDVTIGTTNRTLPGLGLSLAGLAEGQVVTLDLPAERAYGVTDPTRVKRVSRARFAADDALAAGLRTRMRVGRGRSRTVRVVEVADDLVVVDLNHSRSGQSVHMEVELVAILDGTTGTNHRNA